ncbi:MAG: cation-translocating P-type ATPase [Cyanobium sp.]|nr:cation-translocating P-type ATPase [Cyanobium sp.]
MTASDASGKSRQARAEDLLRHWFAGLPQSRRRVWNGPQRSHAQVRSLAAGSEAEAEFAEAVRSLFSNDPEVCWARYNACVGRVVIEGAGLAGDPHTLLQKLQQLEQRLDLLEQPFGSAGAADRDYPADLEPLLLEVLELSVELVGAGLGLVLQGGKPEQRLGLDLAALLRAIEAAPGLRDGLERVLGPTACDLLLSLAAAADNALLRGVAGPLVSLLERGLRLRARLGNRRRRQEIEARLSADPNHHPERRQPSGERPYPLPLGPIERYAEKASMLSLGAFGFGLTAAGNLEGSAAALLAALPRPALLGRSAFSLELARRLAEAGALLLDPEALERLDRLDCVLIDRGLLASVWGPALLTAAREAGLLRVVVAEAGDPLPGEAERRCPPGEASITCVRALQAEGRGVLVLAEAGLPALAAADLSVGLLLEDGPPPWDADLIAGPDLEPLWLLLQACPAARRCASQSVQASLIEVVVGLALCLDGVQRRSALAVNQSTHLLAAVAMANGLRLARSCQAIPPEPAVDTVPWHALEVEEVLRRLHVEAATASGGRQARGTDAESAGEAAGPDWLKPLLAELDSPLVPVLVTGAGLSALLASPVDAGLVLAVLAGNAAIGAAQRLRVERAVAALQERHAAPVSVRRQGELRRLDALALQLGDVIRLEDGEVVPADCRIVAATGLQVDEAVLSGESFPVVKGSEPTAAAALAERSSMLYAGTTVVAGTAEAVVIALGDATEARRGLAAARDAALAGGVEGRLESLTDLTTPIATLSGVAVLLSALARGHDPCVALGEGVALTVAAVPEGLPVLASLAQLAAASRLSSEHVLVRNPRAIASLGRVDVICLDKTGTLTSGQIRLVQICAGERCMPPDQLDPAGQRVLRLALRATPEAEAGQRLAHPTDQGLLEGAAAAGVGRDGWQTLDTLPFEPSRGFHASLCARAGQQLLCVKGSPEVVLAACASELTVGETTPLQPEDRERLVERARQLAERGLRVLAVARRPLLDPPPSVAGIDQGTSLSDADVRDLEFLGFVALEDPIRDTARQALAELRRAGVSACIITGDHPATAHAIARQLDLPSDGSVVTGPMLDGMDEAELQQAVQSTAVFARITAMQKLHIVRALRQAGRVVAMAGDGANDAAAIRLAEVGIALGSRATEAARAAADLVVTDGRIETIVLAVLEGRALWRSVRDAVGLLVGGNLGEIGFTLLAGLVEGRPPLNTRQLLLMNLLTDVAPALAIAMRPPQGLKPEQLLQEGPEASLGSPLEQDILRTAAVTALSSALARSLAAVGGDRRGADTVGLLTLVGTQLGQALTRRHGDGVALLTGLGSFGALVATVQTPLLSQAFGCRPLGPLALLQAGAATVAGTGLGLLLPLLPRWGAPPGTKGGSRPGEAATP